MKVFLQIANFFTAFSNLHNTIIIYVIFAVRATLVGLHTLCYNIKVVKLS